MDMQGKKSVQPRYPTVMSNVVVILDFGLP